MPKKVVKKNEVTNGDNKIQCIGNCRSIKTKNDSNFFRSNNSKHNNDLYSGYAPICKQCLREQCFQSDGKNINIEGFMEVLKFLNKPFVQKEYLRVLNSKNGFDLGHYIKNIAFNYKGLEFKNSDNNSEAVKNATDIIKINPLVTQANQNIDKLREKFGYGYEDKQYILFEKKYQNLKQSVSIKTAMHEEYFKVYCVNMVLSDLHKANTDSKKAKEFYDMAQTAAKAGNFQPKDIDISGGISNFSELSLKIEETPEGELMEVLPRFREEPEDKVDIVLWAQINYLRLAKGLPEAPYKDIYAFYDRRRDAYEKQINNRMNVILGSENKDE